MIIQSQELKEKITTETPFALELGPGQSPRPGFYHLDIVPGEDIDIVGDLNEGLPTLPDNCVSELYTSHTLEHVSNLLPLLGDVYRICRPDAKITVIVPHFAHPHTWSDPTHLRFFGLYTLSYFVSREKQIYARKVPDYYSDIRFNLHSVRLEFAEPRNRLLDKLTRRRFQKFVNKSPARQEFYEAHLARFIPAAQIVHVLSPDKGF
jgi:SAM-dependent methyltransferase